MATQLNTDKNPSRIVSCKQRCNDKISIQHKKTSTTNDKQKRRTESAPTNQINIHGPEVTLLPQDEQECRQMYEKLQRLQPNGACVDINTLRRALYPPVGSATYSSSSSSDQPPNIKTHRPRYEYFDFLVLRLCYSIFSVEEIPLSWIKTDNKYVNPYVPKQPYKSQVKTNESSHLLLPTDTTDIDRIVDQVKKHAAINYSYYTRTK